MSLGVLKAGSDAASQIVFQVSDSLVRTWQEAKRDGEARWMEHEVFEGKPVSEFIGPGLDSIELSVRLDLSLGLVPRDELRKMRKFRDNGYVSQFTIGGGYVGQYKIKTLAEQWNRWSKQGVLMTAVATLSLGEYA
jgi:phage protein U